MSAPRPRVSTRRLMVVGIVVCLLLAGFVSFYASTKPDGLNFVAGEQGFLDRAGPHASDGSPFAGYETKGVGDARVSRATAGIVGGALVFVIAGGLFLAVRRRAGDGDGDTATATASDTTTHTALTSAHSSAERSGHSGRDRDDV